MVVRGIADRVLVPRPCGILFIGNDTCFVPDRNSDAAISPKYLARRVSIMAGEECRGKSLLRAGLSSVFARRSLLSRHTRCNISHRFFSFSLSTPFFVLSSSFFYL